ncbi:MAG: hypothetical protein ACXACI_05075 [Candidatus Hodarchaeales archaeon]|jgi:hypothetical protein
MGTQEGVWEIQQKVKTLLKTPFWIQFQLSNYWVQLGIFVLWNSWFFTLVLLYDRWDVAIEHGLLAWQVFIAVAILIGARLGKHIRDGIIDLYGIDPFNPQKKEPASLEPLLSSSKFSSFKEDFERSLFSWVHNIFACIILAILVALSIPAIVAVLGSDLLLWGIERDYLALFLFSISWICYGILVLQWISAFSSLFVIALSLRRLASYSEISLQEISRFLNGEKIQLDCSKDSEVILLSPKWFKKQCKVIPNFLLPISLAVFAILALFSLFAIYIIDSVSKPDLRIFFLVSDFLPLVILFIILNFVLFFVPQLSLRSLIKTKRTELLNLLDKKYEVKKLQWLRLISMPIDSEKQKLEMELSALSLIMSELKGLSGWPFDVKQISSFLLTFLLPITALSLQFLGLILFR